jgi:hypothetical protein
MDTLWRKNQAGLPHTDGFAKGLAILSFFYSIKKKKKPIKIPVDKQGTNQTDA